MRVLHGYPMRLLKPLLVAVVTAALTLLCAWLATRWADAGAPSLRDLAHAHPALAAIAGLLPLAGGIAALRRRQAQRSR
ncbi:hypothetical protein [Dyella sp. A6]|uniref:hypothetical protein n=1 Tax=Dyella aluminiiresistens TaxID=3069105 RepID=UPI002E76B3EE|nr:hypothetical protein [Dyella sp. A6]